jgi:hypothetical protein
MHFEEHYFDEPLFRSYSSRTGAIQDTIDDLQAALQTLPEAELPSATHDHTALPLGSDMEWTKAEISRNEQCSLVQLPSSSSRILPDPDHVASQPKKNKQGRRPSPNDSSMSASRVGATHEAQSAVTSVASFKSEYSVAEDALATSDATSHVVADDVAEENDCSSSVMHREYFSHVRRVNLENLSLVIGSNLPVFQVILRPQAAMMCPLTFRSAGFRPECRFCSSDRQQRWSAARGALARRLAGCGCSCGAGVGGLLEPRGRCSRN